MPNETVLQLLGHHWVLILVLWFLVNFVNALPAPNGKGFAASPWYKTLFITLHSTFGMLPRIIATVFPAAKKVVDAVEPPDKADAAGVGK